MRNILIIITVLNLFSCEQSEDLDKNNSEHSIIGRWKVVEASYSIGGPEQITKAVEDGSEYTFSNDLTFTSNASPECTSGIYSIQESDTLSYSLLTLQYECTRINTPINMETYTTSFVTPDQIILVPKSVMCREGCSYKFQKQ